MVLARRHLVSNLFVDSTDSKRKRWVEMQARRVGSREFRLDIPGLPSEFSFIVLGDTGEGDSSQLVLVDKFLREGADTAFTVIASDVVYPACRSHHYWERFYASNHFFSNLLGLPSKERALAETKNPRHHG